ncbi:MAG: MoxR family ATPase [Chloroflexi bacterium]|nr:MoxR family ATPase [Chloroflexota bacterium]
MGETGKETIISEQDVAGFIATARRIEEELGRIVVGQPQVLRDTMIALLSGGHVLLEGVPGLGKTLLVRTLGEALKLIFSHIQFTPDLMPADIVGTNVVMEDEQGRRNLRFQQGPIFANLVLADEINRATPKTQSALLEAMQERTVSVGDATRSLPRPFFVLATQNPLEMEGTYPLPEAQLDRFFFKVLVPFPDRANLGEILRRTISYEPARAGAVADGLVLEKMIRLAREVPVASHVHDYAVSLVLATHPEREDAPPLVRKYVRYGASPRGLQTLVIGGQVRALLEGRYNLSVDDLQAVAYPALRHRLILNFEAQAEGITADKVIGHVLEAVPVKT